MFRNEQFNYSYSLNITFGKTMYFLLIILFYISNFFRVTIVNNYYLCVTGQTVTKVGVMIKNSFIDNCMHFI